MSTVQRPAPRQPPWEGPEAEGISFGTWLRQQREVRQIGLREIAESSKVSLRYLEAFEQDRFEILPASVFAKGFLRQYAEYVGLDSDEVINHYLWARQESAAEPSEEEAWESPSGGGESSPWLLVLVAVVVLAAIVAGVFFYVERDRATPVEAPRETFVPPAPPVVPPPPPPAPEPAPAASGAPLDVTVEFIRDCWVEAVIDGDERIAREFSQGESLRLEAQEQVVFRKLGNAGGVSLEVNGRPVDLEAEDGEVMSDLVIDLETLGELEDEA